LPTGKLKAFRSPSLAGMEKKGGGGQSPSSKVSDCPVKRIAKQMPK